MNDEADETAESRTGVNQVGTAPAGATTNEASAQHVNTPTIAHLALDLDTPKNITDPLFRKDAAQAPDTSVAAAEDRPIPVALMLLPVQRAPRKTQPLGQRVHLF